MTKKMQKHQLEHDMTKVIGFVLKEQMCNVWLYEQGMNKHMLGKVCRLYN